MYLSAEYESFRAGLAIAGPTRPPGALPADSPYLHHKYELAPSEIDAIFVRPVYRRVIRSKAFQRLKKIHFLGCIDYVINPNVAHPAQRHTRYQHSLGVARLALQFAQRRGLSEEDEALCVVAALLHDIGHAPLSHSLESVFKSEYGIGHHIASERIIKGDVPVGYDLFEILHGSGINPFLILEIINGTSEPKYREIFRYAVNIDTIEAILRSLTYVYANYIFYPPSTVLDALLARDASAKKILDKFWHLKGEVYSQVINSRLGILADFIGQEYMRRNASAFSESYYYMTEEGLRAKHPDLFKKLEQLSTTESAKLISTDRPISFVKRTFHISDDVALAKESDLDRRYTQSKKEAVLVCHSDVGDINGIFEYNRNYELF